MRRLIAERSTKRPRDSNGTDPNDSGHDCHGECPSIRNLGADDDLDAPVHTVAPPCFALHGTHLGVERAK